MRYIETLHEGETIRNTYLCKGKRSAETRNGKPYDNLILQDKTGTLDGKIWDPNSNGIADYSEKDFIEVYGEIISYNGNLQMNIKQLRVADEGEYDPADYMPTSEKSVDGMYEELMRYGKQVKNPYLQQVIRYYFVNDEQFIKSFKAHSAAKSVHHGFAGGLLEHTLSVVKFCEYMAGAYPILNKDLLYTAAMCHDIGKTQELSLFPDNDYTDDGQLLGHIVIGVEMLDDAIREIPDFPKKLASELKHCIVAHHGELEYGSPKKPALAEAMALNCADNADAKMQTLTELFKDKKGNVCKAKIVKLKSVKDEKTGRFNMVPIEGSEEVIPADVVLIAAGFLGSEKYVTDAFHVALTPRTNVETKPEQYATSVDRVFTAGDMHRGQSLVVWAIHEGREAAKAVDESLMSYSYLQ